LPARARFMPIYMRYKWTKWRFQEARGFSAKVRMLTLPSQCKGQCPPFLLRLQPSRPHHVLQVDARLKGSWLEQRVEAEWQARHEWGGVRVHDMLLDLSGAATTRHASARTVARPHACSEGCPANAGMTDGARGCGQGTM